MVIDNLQLLDYDISPTFADHRPADTEAKLKVPELDLTRPHEDIFSDLYSLGKAKKKEEVPLVKKEEIKILSTPTPPDAPDIRRPVGKEAIQGLIDIFKKEGINVKITSWERPNNTSKSGKKSHHIDGSALDITPGDGETWETLRNKMKGNEIIYDYLLKNNLGIIDETTPEMLKKTGGTGAHWHIGPDKLALQGRDIIYNRPVTKNDPLYRTKFTEKDITKFTRVMTKVYSDVLDEMGLPRTNLVNLVKQAALESNYGTDPRGNGYNLGGIKNFTGNESKGTVAEADGVNYLNFSSLKDFAKFHVMLLNDKYDALAAKDSTDFVNRLHGENPGGRNYSINKQGYSKMFSNMTTLEKIFNSYKVV